MTVRRLAATLALGAALPSLALAQTYPPTYPAPSAPAPQAAPPPPSYPPPSAPAPQYAPPAQQGKTPGRLELTAIAGYQVNTDVTMSSGKLVVDDAPVYGASLGVMARPGSRAELLWLYSDPEAKVTGSALYQDAKPFHVATHYFQIGGTQSIRRDKLEPFGGATLGAALFMPDKFNVGAQSYDYGDTWRFAFTLGLGLKVHLSEKVLLRLETRLAAPVYFYGGGVYVGSGGSGVSMSGGIPIWQWNFLAGLGFSP